MKKSTVHKIKKPKLCFYSDYLIQKGKCFAIFETLDNRVHTEVVCNTERTNADWRTFEVKETKNYLFINLNEWL